MTGINLGGFSIAASSQRAILITFIAYSILIIGLGLFVKKSSGNKLASYLTGDNGLNFLEVAMIAATTAMAGGSMVSGPGLTYKVGFIYSLVCFTLFITNFVTLGTFGKKFAIMKERLNATTLVQLMHHRYQSRGCTIILILASIVFLTVSGGGQLLNAAKVFSAILGTGAYSVGLIIAAIIIIIYAFAGGIKSLAKVSVLQGILMAAAVLFMVFATFAHSVSQYGSIQGAMEYIAQTNSALIDARTYAPLYALSMAIISGWGNTCIPSNMQVAMMYNKPKVLSRSICLSCVMMLLVNGFMSITGPFAYALNSNLTNADYSTIYLTTNLLPGWMAGIVVSGIFAAIQSSIAAHMIFIAGTLTSDLYHDCINKNATEKNMTTVRNVGFVLFGLLMMLIALKPSQLGQLLLVIAAGGFACCFGAPGILGAFWRKATTAGAISSCIGGFIVYFLPTRELQSGSPRLSMEPIR